MKQRITALQEAELSGRSLQAYNAWKLANAIVGQPTLGEVMALVFDRGAPWDGEMVDDTEPLAQMISDVYDARLELEKADDDETRDKTRGSGKLTDTISRLQAITAPGPVRRAGLNFASSRASGRVIITWDQETHSELCDALWVMAKEGLER